MSTSRTTTRATKPTAPAVQRPAPAPPGPGTWTLDAAHIPQPLAGFLADVLIEPFSRGMRATLARYGSLLEDLAVVVLDGFLYEQPRAVGAPPDAAGPPPREVWDGVVSQLPAVQERFAAAERALSTRLWRSDLARWDAEVKPELVQRQDTLRQADLTALTDAALVDHLDACRALLAEGVYQHHFHNGACMIPVGLFLEAALPLTGLSAAELLDLLQGASPASQGFPAELSALRAALEEHPEASAALEDPSADPATLLSGLRTAPGELGAAARRYLALVEGVNVEGEDAVGSPSGAEAPDLVLTRLRSAMRAAPPTPEGGASRLDDARARVPRDRLQEFDDALGEARLVYRLRDERSVYSDKPAGTLCRTALLEAGRRLQARGAVQEPENALDARADEVRALLLAPGDGPTSAELAERTAWRRTASYRDMPPLFGPPPAPPLPAQWLPPAAARVHAALGLMMEAVLAEPPARTTQRSVHGLAVSSGIHDGRAVVVRDLDDLRRVERGDVLVTTCTGPAFNLVLPLVGAVVTDRGGLLSHAAIVAREFCVPAVVGCSDATVVVRDGDRVRVDGTTGVVTVL